MSIALMTLAWKSSLPAGPKMVLLALCDNANDQGECYPSVPMLAEKCSMGVRTVQQHINDMEAAGIISREMRHGRSTVYHISAELFTAPADSAPRKIRTPQISHPTPADSAPITINEPPVEPPKNPKRAPTAPAEPIGLPDWLPLDAWSGFLAMRREKKKAPTDRAVELILADLAKWRAAGHDVAAILNKSTRNGWLDVFAPKDPPAAGQSGQAQPVAAHQPRKPQGFDPKGLDESPADYDARIAAAEAAHRRKTQP